jgi:hypothetical protein
MSGFVRGCAVVLTLAAFGAGLNARADEARSPAAGPALVVQAPPGDVVDTEGKLTTVSPVKGQPPTLMLIVIPVNPTVAAGMDDAALGARVSGGMFATWAKAGSAITGPTGDGTVTIAGKAARRYRGSLAPKDGPTEDVDMAIIRMDDGHVGFLAVVGKRGEAATSKLETAMLAATIAAN